jgi:hypothetical protein
VSCTPRNILALNFVCACDVQEDAPRRADLEKQLAQVREQIDAAP